MPAPAAPYGALLAGLRSRLAPDRDVVALGVFGSRRFMAGDASAPEPDEWSDLDAVVVLREGAPPGRYFPDLSWLSPLGEIFASSQSAGPFSSTTRVCFTSFARLDVVLTTEGALAAVASWPAVPFWGGCSVVFSRVAAVTRALEGLYDPPPPGTLDGAAFGALTDDFWFKATQAVVKVGRGDRLIALHLALDLLRDCCVLEMLLRDREAGTSVHRHGGRGNAFVTALRGAPPGSPAAGILDLVEECALCFDRLAGAWWPGYTPRAAPLLGGIARARRLAPD